MKENNISELYGDLEDKFLEVIKIITKTVSLGLEPEEAKISFEFFTIPFKGDEVFVPTGTTKVPSGISVTTADHILFVNKEDFSFFIKSKKSLLEYLRENWGKLKKELDSEYKTNGVVLKITEI